MSKYKFYSDCVHWPPAEVQSLMDMVEDGQPITRRTFLKHVDRDELKILEKGLSYESHPKRGLTMAADWAVNYQRSTLCGKRVYFFQQSAIEYVFTHP